MKTRTITRVLVLLGLSAGVLPGPPAAAQSRAERESLKHATDLSLAFQYASRVIAPSVVNIRVVQRVEARRGRRSELENFLDQFSRPRGGRPGEAPGNGRVTRGQGSGVIIRPDGHILTNHHVVENAVEIQVTLTNGRRYEATIVGTDDETDLAVIKIDARDLDPATFADSDAIVVGQWVLAVGNPFGLDSTVTAGIISAIGRGNMGLAEYGNLIQTDAAINPGNSGGPLVNLRGEVLGINNAITTENGGNLGIGFAIPSDMALSVMNSILEHGEVIRGWLGITMRPLDSEESRRAGLTGEGVLIINVSSGSPADEAGLREGDIITDLNGKVVKSSSQLQNAVARRAPGTRVEMTVLRDGRDRRVPVLLGERPPLSELQLAQVGAQASEELGILVRELSAEQAEDLDVRIPRGVVVIAVMPDGLAHTMGIQAGDVIIALGDQRIETLGDFERALRNLDVDNGVHITYQRGRRTVSVE